MAKTTALPKIGDIVLLHTEGGDVPLMVTAVGDDGISGQTFLAGTERGFVENAKPGTDEGQFSKRE